MNLSDWRASRKRTKTVTLPSGLDVEVQPVSFGAFVRGNVPDHLTPVVSQLFEGKGISGTNTLDGMRRYFDVMDAVALQAIVNPKVVASAAEAGEGEIGVDELSEEDKAALMPLLGMTARTLESFRIEPPDDVEPVLSGESDEPSAE